MSRLLSIPALLLLSCTPQVEDGPKAKAQEVANNYLKSRSIWSERRPVTIEDSGSAWLVIYHVPEGYTGGEQRVWVDKRKMEVTDFIAWQ